MLRGLYSAATALETAAVNQEIISENLANVATPGFRRHNLLFQTLFPQDTTDRAAGVTHANSATAFEPGPVMRTDAPFDVSLEGNVFFVLEGPSGPVYTRNGSFEVNARGELQSKSGLRVRGQGGPITIPGTYRNVTISNTGAVHVDGTELGRLDIASFQDLASLRRVGGTLFQGDAPQTPPPDSFRVVQGHREGSNVQPVNEMISMVLGVRYFEAAERSMRMIGEAMSQQTRPQS